MSKKKPPNPYEEANRNIDRIIAELDAQLKGDSHVLGRKDPGRPYEAPKGSWERAENAILMGVAVAALLFGFCIIILGSL